jgi:colanic acid biosynthesis glycosyl transferase WcaI
MRFLIITQVFWPDTASTAQHLADLADYLIRHNHTVKVISSRYAYENTGKKYKRREEHNGIIIERIRNTNFGKASIIGRLLDFLSFNFLLVFKLAFIRKKEVDVIIGMTSPPLVSFFGVWFAKRKKSAFHYWTMDLQPELSIASGLIKDGSISARLFTGMGNYIFRHANRVIALDKYMGKHVIQRGASAGKVSVVPVWPVMETIYEGSRSENPFRINNGFGDRIVVMYSGNHSFVHPLDTLLQAALQLKDDPRFLFVFIGEGVRKKDVLKFKEAHDLSSVAQLPYQPRNLIHYSLGSADLQVVILGENQVGYTHPNKIYGAMFIGKPILYIGPGQSHISDILDKCPGNISVQHGDSRQLVQQLLAFAGENSTTHREIGKKNEAYARANFHPDQLKQEMMQVLCS